MEEDHPASPMRQGVEQWQAEPDSDILHRFISQGADIDQLHKPLTTKTTLLETEFHINIHGQHAVDLVLEAYEHCAIDTNTSVEALLEKVGHLRVSKFQEEGHMQAVNARLQAVPEQNFISPVMLFKLPE